MEKIKRNWVAVAATLLLACHVPAFATVSTLNVVNQYTGDGATTVFPFTYAVQKTSDVQVYVAGVLQVSGYTVTINSNGVGGSVNFSVAPGSGVALSFNRIVPLTQQVHLVSDGVLSPIVLEKAYDKLTMAAQQLNAASGSGVVQSVAPGTGIGVAGTSAVPIINNLGVLDLTPGSNVTIGGTAQHPVINSTGGGGGGGNVFTSTDQTITTNGTLGPIAHGLGVVPASVIVALVCQSPEAGYSAGDITYAVTAPSTGSLGKVVADATNLNVVYGSGTKVFGIFNKSTLAAVDATNANWKMRIYASNVIISGGGGGGGAGSVSSVSTVSTPSWLTSTWATATTTPAQTIASAAGITQNQVLATPNGSSGVLSPRALVSADIPAGLPIANGGTNNGSLSVSSGTIYYGDGTKIVGLTPGSGFLQMNGSLPPTIVPGSGNVLVSHVQLSAAQIIALNGTPITLIAAQGAGTTVVLHTTLWRFTPGGTQFAGNLNPAIYYSGGNSITNTVSSAVVNSASPAEIVRVPGDVTALQNTGVVVKAATGAATTGTGTLDLYVTYSVH